METLPKNAPNPKPRKCLMCGKSFMSEWAGERVCKRCKASTSWRQGHMFSGKGRAR